MSPRSRVAVSWLPVVFYMALIWVLSSMRLGPLPLSAVPFEDKGVHFLEFGALGLLVAHAAFRTWPDIARGRTFFVAILITVGWGVLDELHQSFVPGRSADVLDIVADGLGAFAGASGRVLVSRLLSRDERERDDSEEPQESAEPTETHEPEEPAAS